ncbi:MAG: carboxypeptidase regulatory-like domain-containing protein [Thermoanaerobaculum sp.]
MRRIVVPCLALGLLALWALPAMAADTQPFKPQVIYPSKFDISKPLREVKVGKPVEMGKPREVVNRSIPKVQPTGGGKYNLTQNLPGPLSTPSPLLTFQGLDSDDNQAVLGFRVMPPDTEGDVGPNRYFEWVNLVFQIYDKTTGNPVLPNPLPGNAFWQGFGGPCETDNDGDPIVLYDHFADRWFVQQFSTTAPYRLCFALSQTNDPAGSYYRWEYVFSNNKFPDYPKTGVWPDAYYIGFNQFLNLQSPSGAGVLALDKAAMLANSQNPVMIYFDLNGVNPNFANLFPADADGLISGTPDGIFAEWDEAGWLNDPTDTLRIWYFHPDWTTPANSTFGLSGQPNELVTVADVDSNMCGYSRDCIPQQGTSQKLDALSDRLMYRIQYREFPGYKVLITAQTVDADGTDHAGVHWRELRNSGTGWSEFQAGTYAPDANHRWMPSAAMDASGNICVAYSISSSTMYPSAAYACRDAGDPPGTLGTEVIYKVGTGYQGGGNRWGDYSTISVDPTDQCTFWAAEEYGRASGSFFWSTFVASFKMPSCVAGPSGTVFGTVTNAITTNPIANAQVQAMGLSNGPFTTFTNSSGQYTLTLPPDTYDITFSAFGYQSWTATGIVVNNGDNIQQDAQLQPTATAGLDGYVMGQAHGWPLYAKVVVKYSGNPVATVYTNPFNGYYDAGMLPALVPYTVEVTPLIAGYNSASQTIASLPISGQTLNFVLSEDGTQDFITCVLQGGLNENFDGPFPPPGWKVEVYNSNTNNNWRRNDQWGRSPNPVPGGSGYAAGADSDKAGSGSGNFDTALVTPYIQMPATPRELAYNHYFRIYYSTDRGYVDVCVSPCNSWTNLKTFSTTNSAPQTVDLSAYAGQTIKLRFRYVSGDWAWYWYIDDVRTQVPATPPPPPTSQWVQNFDIVSPPAVPSDWTVTDVSGTAGNWATATATVHPSGNPPHSAPNLVYFNSYSASTGSSTRLWKNTTDTIPSGQTGFVGFWMYHDTGFSGAADRVQVQYSTDGGTTWTNAGSPVQRYDGSTGWKYHQIELTGATGTINIGLLGISGYGNDVHVDDVEFLVGTGGTPPIPDNPTLVCNPVPGTLVEGFVTDANTNLPVVGASILNNDTGRNTTSFATPNDPNLADGFYYLFVPLPGSGPSTRTFTASKTGYGNDVKTANLPPNTVYQINFALPAGWLQVSPTSLFSRLYTGQDEHQNLTITNLGGMPANFSLVVVPQATTWPHLSPVTQGSAPSGPSSIGRAPAVNPPAYGKIIKPYLTSVEAYAVDLINGNLVHWNDLTVPGTWNVVAPDPNDDFGGDFLLGDFSKLYVLDYTNNQLATIDTTTGARTVIGSATPVGGQAWTGLTASVGGTLYATSTDCSASTLYTVDPNTGAATVVGPITNAPCAIALAITPAGDMYVVDIGNDNLVKVDPSTGAGTIIGPLGINAAYAQGMDYDEVNGVLYWAAYNAGTHSGELRVIDTTTGASTLVGAFPGAAEVDALAIKNFGGGVCWLTLTPDSGTVPANSQVNVDAHFAASASCPPIYGSQRATITVVHNTAYPVTNPSVCFYRAFNDVPQGYVFDKAVHAIGAAKISQGFGGNFNPAGSMTRGNMARWLLLARYGNTYSPPACTGIFADVDCENTPNADWIEDLYNKGITSGCSTNPLKYCPNTPVDRAQMAKFLLKAKELPGYTPPPCTGIFSDVPCPGGFLVDWIEEISNRGITSGCAPGLYCPTQITSRGEMAKFVVKTWSIPTCP